MSKVVNVETWAIPQQNPRGLLEFSAALVNSGTDIDPEWRCYMGQGQPEWIARHGVKLTYRQALIFFPSLKETEYAK